jgi:Skp family chaperone for outer membrane proteins
VTLLFATMLCRLRSLESLAVVTLLWVLTILTYSWGDSVMRYRWLRGVFLVPIASVMVCQNVGAESATGTDKIVREARETLEATKEYTDQQKAAVQRKAQEELSALQQQIAALRGKVADASASTREELQKSLNELEKKKDGVREKLDELKHTTDKKWQDVQDGMNNALHELKQSYHRLLSRVP